MNQSLQILNLFENLIKWQKGSHLFASTSSGIPEENSGATAQAPKTTTKNKNAIIHYSFG
jgi:hypothetical protein